MADTPESRQAYSYACLSILNGIVAAGGWLDRAGEKSGDYTVVSSESSRCYSRVISSINSAREAYGSIPDKTGVDGLELLGVMLDGAKFRTGPIEELAGLDEVADNVPGGRLEQGYIDKIKSAVDSVKRSLVLADECVWKVYGLTPEKV